MTFGSFTCTRFVGMPTEASTTTLGQGKSLQILVDKALLSGSHSITQPPSQMGRTQSRSWICSPGQPAGCQAHRCC